MAVGRIPAVRKEGRLLPRPGRGRRRGRHPAASTGAAAAGAEAARSRHRLELEAASPAALEPAALAADPRDHRGRRPGRRLGHRRAEIGITPAFTRTRRAWRQQRRQQQQVAPLLVLHLCLRPKRKTREKVRMIPGRRMAATTPTMTSRQEVRRLPGRRRPRPSARTRTSPDLADRVVVVAGPRVPARAAAGPRAAVTGRAGAAAVDTRAVIAAAAAIIAITNPPVERAVADQAAGARHPAPGESTTTSAAAVGSGRRPICCSWSSPSSWSPAAPSRRSSSRASWASAIPARRATSRASPTRRRRCQRLLVVPGRSPLLRIRIRTSSPPQQHLP